MNRDPLWRGSEKLIGTCPKCGREGLKRNMATLMIRADGRSPFRTVAHLCPDCLATLLEELEVSMPD